MVQTKLIKLPIIKYFVHINAEKNSEPFEMRTQAPLYVPLKTDNRSIKDPVPSRFLSYPAHRV